MNVPQIIFVDLIYVLPFTDHLENRLRKTAHVQAYFVDYSWEVPNLRFAATNENGVNQSTKHLT